MIMNDDKTFRQINKIELGMIHRSIVKISNIAISVIAKSNHELVISESSSHERYFFPIVYLVPNSLFKVIHNLKSNIYSAGLYFGFIKKGSRNSGAFI